MSRRPGRGITPRVLRTARPFVFLVLAGVLGCALFAGLGTAQNRSEWVHQRHFRVDAPWGSAHVLATWARRDDGREFPTDFRTPILVALHGRGEALRGPDRGYLGWNVDYRLPDAFGALRRGRLTARDYQGLARAEHLRAVNAGLRAQPFAGVLVITPFTPDLISEPAGSPRIAQLASWIVGPLLADVRQRFPASARTREGTGIDGVSLGAMLSLEIGLAHPEAFGAVGAIQPAIRGREANLAARAAAARPRPAIALLSSDGDPLLGPTRDLSARLTAAGVAHTLTVVPGPHDYVFNRGPGGIEMLLFHDRALAREPLDARGSLPAR